LEAAEKDLAMSFKSAKWYPIAIVLSVLNFVGAGFAVGQAEPLHATIHVALGLAFGLWAQRLRQPPDGTELQDRLEALEAEVGLLGDVRQELAEIQERLDFAERLLAQGQDAHRVSPQR
jgi:hypothetical protein